MIAQARFNKKESEPWKPVTATIITFDTRSDLILRASDGTKLTIQLTANEARSLAIDLDQACMLLNVKALKEPAHAKEWLNDFDFRNFPDQINDLEVGSVAIMPYPFGHGPLTVESMEFEAGVYHLKFAESEIVASFMPKDKCRILPYVVKI